MNDISSDGSTIVGSYYDVNATLRIRAFVWTERSGMQDLTILLQSLGVEMGDIVLSNAISVSADGKTIAVEGLVPRSPAPVFRQVAFVAVIPEPTAALLVGLGLAGLSTRRRDRSDRPDAD